MSKEQITNVISEILNVPILVEATLERNEFYAYADAWFITIEQLDRIREKMNVTAITIDGCRIMLTIKI